MEPFSDRPEEISPQAAAETDGEFLARYKEFFRKSVFNLMEKHVEPGIMDLDYRFAWAVFNTPSYSAIALEEEFEHQQILVAVLGVAKNRRGLTPKSAMRIVGNAEYRGSACRTLLVDDVLLGSDNKVARRRDIVLIDEDSQVILGQESLPPMMFRIKEDRLRTRGYLGNQIDCPRNPLIVGWRGAGRKEAEIEAQKDALQAGVRLALAIRDVSPRAKGNM